MGTLFQACRAGAAHRRHREANMMYGVRGQWALFRIVDPIGVGNLVFGVLKLSKATSTAELCSAQFGGMCLMRSQLCFAMWRQPALCIPSSLLAGTTPLHQQCDIRHSGFKPLISPARYQRNLIYAATSPCSRPCTCRIATDDYAAEPSQAFNARNRTTRLGNEFASIPPRLTGGRGTSR